MKIYFIVFILFILSGCLDSSENPGEESEVQPVVSDPQSCTLDGSWTLEVVRVETDNPPGPCGLQDCGYGSEPNCGRINASTATFNNSTLDVEWFIPMAGLVGDNWDGQYNDDLEFELIHEFFPNSTFKGTIDPDDCSFEATMTWNPPSCVGEFQIIGTKD